ncbi:MAG: hypothetical protein ACYS22_16985 [Planctomycetota bacterium]|jgi:hypothetical protein
MSESTRQRVSPLQLGLGAVAGALGAFLAFAVVPGAWLPKGEAQGSLGPVERDLQQLKHLQNIENELKTQSRLLKEIANLERDRARSGSNSRSGSSR